MHCDFASLSSFPNQLDQAGRVVKDNSKDRRKNSDQRHYPPSNLDENVSSFYRDKFRVNSVDSKVNRRLTSKLLKELAVILLKSC